MKSFLLLAGVLSSLIGVPAFAAELTALPLPAVASSAPTEFWVDYMLHAYTRPTEKEAWDLKFQGPFGLRSGISVGYVLTYRDITDPAIPNCYAFEFAPQAFDGLKRMTEKLVVTEYHGDFACTNSTPGVETTLETLYIDAHQGETAVLELPFLKGEKVKFELGETWKIAP
jgi:hypothetical protein